MKELLYQLALTRIPKIGNVHAKVLMQQFESAEAIFKAPVKDLERAEGIGCIRAGAIKNFNDFSRIEQELEFLEKYQITPLFLKDKEYPQRLLQCYDPPTLLFYRGTANLNAQRMVAIIGTRNQTEYGRRVTEKLVEELTGYNVHIVSGLALGIDALAHKSAIKYQIPTIGVLAHGLDTMYPYQHRTLAKEMLQAGGGLLTEFPSNTPPDKYNFPTRNRIVAGMCDAVIVVETGIKGGSMITAELANSYNRDVFAVPGKITDTRSGGCNYLIRQNKAVLLSDVQHMAEMMNWTMPCPQATKKQRVLFHELSENERKIISILSDREPVPIDELNLKSGISSSAAAAAILNLELNNIIQSQPGKTYKML